MTRAQLLQHFDTLAETPDAVAKLRKLVLDFAIRGRLVPQNPRDEPAIQLVERAKASLTRKRGKSTEQQNGEHEVLPFSLPKNWCWTCLDELGDTSPRNELGDKTEVGFSPMRLVNAKYGEPISFERKTWSEVRKGFTHFAEGDVVVAKITPCFENGKSGVIRGAPNGFGAGTTELHVLRPVANCVLPEYVLVFVKSPHFLLNGEKHMTGSAGQKRVPWDYFARTPFSLPPLAEQRRIVAKVEELLALCDELEAAQTAAREHRTRLVRSALDHLTTAQTEPEFRQHAAFVLQHSDPVLDSVSDLRETILSLAVQGRLSIKGEALKQTLLGEMLAEPSLNGVSKAPSQYPPGIEMLRISAGTSRRDSFVNEDDFKFVELSKKELEKFKLRPNDLLACRFNGNLHFVGRVSLYRGESGRVQVNPDKLIRFRVDESRYLPRFVCYAMNAQPTRIKIEAMCATTAGNIGISATELKEVSIPVPPLAEQQRIVAKVDELLRWCDALAARLTAAQTTAATFLDATLHQILAA